jgi:hypothetical protein
MAGNRLFYMAMAITLFAPCTGRPDATKPQGMRTVEIDAINGLGKDDRIRGPVAVKLKRVNTLRYMLHTDRLAAYAAAPALPLIPTLPAPKPPATKAPGTAEILGLDGGRPRTPGLDPFSDEFLASLGELGDLERRQVEEIEGAVAVAASGAKKGRDEVEALVRASDGVLQAGDSAALLAQVLSVLETVKDARQRQWPTDLILQFGAEAERLEARLLALPHIDPRVPQPKKGGTVDYKVPLTWAEWYVATKKADYDLALDRVREVLAYVDAVGPESKPAVAFRDVQSALAEWQRILEAISARGVDAFTITLDEPCHAAFEKSKTVKIELVKTDRLAAPGTAAMKAEVVTVECATPLSVSAGLGFTFFVDEVEYGFVQSTKPGTAEDGTPTTTVIKEFGYLEQSNFRVSPLLLINTRLHDWNDTWALHLSAGAVVDFKGDPGTDIEFVVGPSLSLHRTMFITLGLQAARVPQLAGGFAVGDEVPSGVAAPPLEKKLEPGLLIAFTYKVKP